MCETSLIRLLAIGIFSTEELAGEAEQEGRLPLQNCPTCIQFSIF